MASAASLGRQQGAAAVLAAAPAGVLGLELLGVRLVDDQAVVVVQLFAGLDVAQALMKTRPSSSSASQLGSQEWLIQREELPPTGRR
jgi:hypothetical protein